MWPVSVIGIPIGQCEKDKANITNHDSHDLTLSFAILGVKILPLTSGIPTIGMIIANGELSDAMQTDIISNVAFVTRWAARKLLIR